MLGLALRPRARGAHRGRAQARRLACECVVSRSEVQLQAVVRGRDRATTSRRGECRRQGRRVRDPGARARFIVELRGSYSGVMGLPLYETGQLLDKCPVRDRRRSSLTSRRRKRASRSLRSAWCRSCWSSAPRAAAWSAASTPGASRGCCPACSRRSSTSAWSAPRSCTSPTSAARAAKRQKPIEKHARRGRAAAGAGGEGPDRLQGRAPVDADLDRRAACSSTCRTTRISASRRRSRTRAAARRCASGCSELVPADEKGGFIVRTLAESATEEELRADLDYLRSLWQRDPRALRAEELRALRSRGCCTRTCRSSQRVLRDMVSAETAA